VDDELLADLRRKGAELRRRLERLPAAVEVRGAGLLLGLEIDRVASDAIAECLERGVLMCPAGERVLRIAPPLTITDDELSQAIGVLEEVLA
jgi:acetylornithine/succinyldiaminopimelate/putrescine aminotransferase